MKEYNFKIVFTYSSSTDFGDVLDFFKSLDSFFESFGVSRVMPAKSTKPKIQCDFIGSLDYGKGVLLYMLSSPIGLRSCIFELTIKRDAFSATSINHINDMLNLNCSEPYCILLETKALISDMVKLLNAPIYF